MSGFGHDNRPWIIVLTGSSSAGKTSLARALHDRLDQPSWLFVADECFPVPPTTLDGPGPGEKPIVLFHRAVAVWADGGQNVILDGSLPYGDTQTRDACLAELARFDTYLVGVTAHPDALEVRELSRAEPRPRGWAVRQHNDVNDGLELACTVDTTQRSPAQAAGEVMAALRSSSW